MRFAEKAKIKKFNIVTCYFIIGRWLKWNVRKEWEVRCVKRDAVLRTVFGVTELWSIL